MKLNSNFQEAEAQRRQMLKIQFYGLVVVLTFTAAILTWQGDVDKSLRHFLMPFVFSALGGVLFAYVIYRFKTR